MSLFIIPRKVSLRLEKIQRDFLWGGGASQSKPHLVNWSIVCMEKKDGGLGIRNLFRLNKALLGKWCWRFTSEQDSLWKQVIVRKFGEEDGGWCSGDSRESHGVGLWKAIRKGWMEFSKRVALRWGMVEECVFRRIGGVEKILWMRLFQGCTILPPPQGCLGSLSYGISPGIWVIGTPVFTRLNNDWEMEEVETFFSRLHGHALKRGIEDVMSWRVLKERERKEKNLNSHSCNVYLQLRYIYIQG
ncbi:putative ribonuclease H protein [Vitis vinifera]|uniref:Putative ribonuclease H protein n=1 Tax=Vitis vinifera TaxID=29760 RepID=A0A438I277_VITVI|nr:putative ribonuclease H protein [Vitis vinifera]